MSWAWRALPGRVAGLTRWSDWSGTKVSLLLVVFYYHALLAELRADPAGGVAPAELLEHFAAIFVFICLGYSFGYAANDFADREVDRLAGKPNALGRAPPAVAGALLVSLAAAGMATLWPFYDRPLVLELVVANYVVGALYSLPPVRFKERGSLGLLVSATAQRALPALIVWVTFVDLDWHAGLFGCLLLLIGLRWILVHQVLDLDADRQAGVRTYVTREGRQEALQKVRWLVFPLEVGCLGAVLAEMLSRLPALGLLLLPYGLWLGLWLYWWGGIGSAFSFRGYDRQPLADFYCVYWPLSLLLLLVVEQPALWPLAVVFVLWQGRYFVLAAVMLRRCLQARWSRTRGGTAGSTVAGDLRRKHG